MTFDWISLFLLSVVLYAAAGGYSYARGSFWASIVCALLCGMNLLFVRLEIAR